MGEVHIIGSIMGYSNFFSEGSGLYCCFTLESGNKAPIITDGVMREWQVISGHVSGITHIDESSSGEGHGIWDHPIDVHYACPAAGSSINVGGGWPRINVQVWRRHLDGRNIFCGYGFCHCPITAITEHDLDVVVWRPIGDTITQRLASYFLGARPQLTKDQGAFATNCLPLEETRVGLCTMSVGVVHINLNIFVLKSLKKYGL